MELRDWGGESRKYKIRQVQQKSDHFGHEKSLARILTSYMMVFVWVWKPLKGFEENDVIL